MLASSYRLSRTTGRKPGALALLLCLAATCAIAAPSSTETAPTLIAPADWQRMAEAEPSLPLFGARRAQIAAEVDRAMADGIKVPVPHDPGGGYTHEQHKRNYRSIHGAGTLYRLTGERKYADFARDMLLEYARLYPTLGSHPQGRGQIPGRLFWQTLNDSVWLVYAIQGYDAIRATLTPAQLSTIDSQVFRRMANFLAGNAANFDRIHNHATWACAAVGMTGYVLREPEFVEKALRGSAGNGASGFLKQLDELFSPDGLYEEGPYYQRYALAPFVIFARAIEQNDPDRQIFAYRDGVLLKAVNTVIQTSYAGLLFPLNDAIKDKGIDSEEIVTGVAIAYGKTRDPGLLDIAQRQRTTIVSPDGLAVAEGLKAGLERPFEFRTALLRDGPNGDRGGLAILRHGGDGGQALVMKNTSQGMGHGHFDRLNWLFYDNGREIIRDYGAARFLNIESKRGGIYLPENDSWAKQTVAHNTLVVDGRSHFNGKLAQAQTRYPVVTFFAADEQQTSIVSARMDNVYEGVSFTRTLVLASHPQLALPVVLDLLRVSNAKPRQYDLPLHFEGHIVDVGFEAQRNVTSRPILGETHGYQHLWVDASSAIAPETRSLSWILDGRFYTYRFGASAPSQALLVESGANDPDFNLRREQALLQRITNATDTTFFSVLEPHGAYDGTAETVVGAKSQIRKVSLQEGTDAAALILELASGHTLAIAIANDAAADLPHQLSTSQRSYKWTGAYARFDE